MKRQGLPVQKLEASPANPETGALSLKAGMLPASCLHPYSAPGELHHTGSGCARDLGGPGET